MNEQIEWDLGKTLPKEPNPKREKALTWWRNLTLPQRSKLLHSHYLDNWNGFLISKSSSKIEELYSKEMALPTCTICGKLRKPTIDFSKELILSKDLPVITAESNSIVLKKKHKTILKKDVVKAQNLIKAYEKQEAKKKELKSMYLVEVLQSSGTYYWYRKHIGERFQVVDDPKGKEDYMLITGGSYLVKTDCKIIKKYSKKVSLKK